MLSKTLCLATSLASLALTAPLDKRDDIARFGLISTHSGDVNVHLRPITASAQRLWLGKPTSSYCPSNLPAGACPPGDTTSFATSTAPDSTRLAMNVVVPGGQSVYVAPDGAIGYTIAHSAAIPSGSIVEPFNYTAPAAEGTVGSLTGPAGFLACPDGVAGEYQIFAQVPGFTRTDCTGIGAAASPVEGSGAWQYA